MMIQKVTLESLLEELSCKTPIQEIPSDIQNPVTQFLTLEKEYRKQYRIKRLLRSSGIKQVKTFTQFDWNFNPKTKKADIFSFKNSPWVKNAFNLVLIGDTGLGKTHIAKALCYEAILQGFPTYCITAFDLISKIQNSLNQSTKIEYYSKIRVLCIDELGYTFYNKENSDCIFQIISKRTEILPSIVTTNLPPKDWGALFSGSCASAILDRLSYNGKFITFEGRSYRLLKKRS